MRLIDADALKRKAQKEATTAWKMRLTAKVETVMNQFIDWLDNAPTIEPERKTGRWRRRLVDSGFNADWHCSECGWKTSLEEHGYNFCPNCGAKMEGEADAEIR